ncbi:MAG: hypothetical protein HFI69_10040 [Lachnospiraceae bacterium]|nr:hypothetical protein [Lachnospiraceae bacterium]
MSVNNVSNTSTAAYTSNVYQNNYRYDANTSRTDDKDKDKNQGVVYEKSTAASKNVYAKEDVVARMKKDAEDRTNQLRSLVQQMMGNQGGKIGQADDMWRFLAKGDFTVSPEVKAQAQKDIADDGYWGVNQTSDRIIEFAKALVGDDPEKAEQMRAAFEKGFKAATKSWGKELPSISQRTYDAVMDKFDDWAGVETKA